MLIRQPPMTCEVKHHICDYHKRNPYNHSFPGCTCSSSYTAVVKPLKEWTEEEQRQYFMDIAWDLDE